MTDAYRQIAVFIDPSPRGERLLLQAGRLAHASGAALTAVFGAEMSALGPEEAFVRGQGAIGTVLEKHREDDRVRVAEALAPLRTAAGALNVPVEFRTLWAGAGGDEALRFLDCDLMVAAHPPLEALPRDWSAERLLTLNGGPMLLIPSEWPGDKPGQHVVVAWNGSRQARRAVTDALPLLRAAGRVTVLVVDADAYVERSGGVPGEDMVAYLSRFDINADLHRAISGEATIAETLSAETAALGADLVVIGCYSRSRTVETIFGGVTRTLLRQTELPLFLSF